MDSFARRLSERISEEYHADTIALPTLPELAARIRAAINDPGKNLGDIARIVQLDPSLVGRLIRIANSPLHRGRVEVDSCRAAITRLGLDATRSLVTGLLLHAAFRPAQPRLRQRYELLWRHSSHVAAIAYVLARLTPGMQPEQALLAGLVHDIGALPVLHYAAELGVEQQADAVIDDVVRQLRGQLGYSILRKWRFPENVALIPLHAEDWMRAGGEEIDYLDVVIVAQVHSYFGSSGQGQVPRLCDVPAFKKLPISSLGPDTSVEVLVEAKEEIREVMSMLGV
ncbi:MAG: hypothetical protein AMJ69_07690 [Gammaproteobacteria bacterium SG8_47]|nr:MAG: hypothetical protein AMJ69_07690 [Gammaproteobacteria bacterium SG8_47]